MPVLLETYAHRPQQHPVALSPLSLHTCTSYTQTAQTQVLSQVLNRGVGRLLLFNSLQPQEPVEPHKLRLLGPLHLPWLLLPLVPLHHLPPHRCAHFALGDERVHVPLKLLTH